MEASWWRSVPTDCLLHVFLRIDPVSIVRCAAVCKCWRRVLIDNASEIRRHPFRQADRHLLLGFHYRKTYPGELDFSRRSSWSPSARRNWWHDLPAPSYVPVVENIDTKFYSPLAWSDGLLLLCRGFEYEIFVCNPLTGFHESIPCLSQFLTCHYFLHSCHGTELNPSPNNFQLLAMDIDQDSILALQNYSSVRRAWAPIFRPTAVELRMPHRDFRVTPVACRGNIHWLCTNLSEYPWGQITHTVEVDISTGQARMTRLPMQCVMREDYVSIQKKLMLATTESDRLSLLRVEEVSLEISIWLYDGDLGVYGSGRGTDGETSWVRWRSINVKQIVEDAGLAHYRLGGKDWAVLVTRLEWFCPKSRHIVLRIPNLGLFVLNLRSLQIQRAAAEDSQMRIWPFEIDTTLCLSSMKQYLE